MPPMVRLGLEAGVVSGRYWKLGNSPWKRKLLMFAGTLLLVWVLMLQLDTTSVELPEFTDPPIAYDHLSSEKEEPYISFGTPPVRDEELYAVKQFPDVRSCLVRAEQSKDRPDLRQIDWSRMNTKFDIKVCMFRIFSSYQTPIRVKQWFISQKLTGVSQDEYQGKTELLQSVRAYNYPRKTNNVYVSPRGVGRQIKLKLIYVEEFKVIWRADNSVFATAYESSSL